MKISKKIITGIFGFSFMLGLVGCSQSTNINANLAKVDEVQTPTIEEQILMTDQIKLQKEKLHSNNSKIMNLNFEDFVVSINDKKLIFTTEVTNKTQDTVILKSENIEVYSDDIKLNNLFSEIKIFEDECLTVSFETELPKTNSELKLTITNNLQKIVFE